MSLDRYFAQKAFDHSRYFADWKCDDEEGSEPGIVKPGRLDTRKQRSRIAP